MLTAATEVTVLFGAGWDPGIFVDNLTTWVIALFAVIVLCLIVPHLAKGKYLAGVCVIFVAMFAMYFANNTTDGGDKVKGTINSGQER